MQNDLLALGFITAKSDGLLFRVESGTSSDYLQLETVKSEGRLYLLRPVYKLTYSVIYVSFNKHKSDLPACKATTFYSRENTLGSLFRLSFVL